jgi:hypothetical protein
MEEQTFMVVEIKEYTSAEQLAEFIDQEIGDVKSTLGEYLRRLDEIRTLAEKSKKIRDVVLKLAGRKNSTEGMGEITVGNLNIILDATPFHELVAIESVVRSFQERLLTLQKTREALRWLDQVGDTDGLRYLVVEDDGVPERILFKLS